MPNTTRNLTGIFTDDFSGDNQRDQGIAQSAAIVDERLILPITASVFALSADITQPTSRPFTLNTILEQLFRTGDMKVNTYQAFAVLPAKVRLTPSVDYWTESQTRWTSAATQVFGSGNRSTTTTSTQVASRTSTAIAHLRQINVRFNVEGFGAGEILDSILFDGVNVTPGGTLTANAQGSFSGTFRIPANIPAGAKTVRFEGRGGTQGTAMFVGQGTLNVTNMHQVHTTTLWWEPVRIVVDPLAQTFTLERDTQLAAIDLWFTAKDTEVRIQLRDVENGIPTGTVFAEAVVDPSSIVVSGGGHTRIAFDAPVALNAGTEYAFVVLCNDATTAVLFYDALIPSAGSASSSVVPALQLTDNSGAGAWQAMPLVSSKNIDDGWAEYTHELALDGNDDLAKVKLTLTGTLSARPELMKLRFMAVK